MHKERRIAFARTLRNNATLAEIHLWEYLRKRRMNGWKFLRQHPVTYHRFESKRHIYIADFYCREKKIIVELDGDAHIGNEGYGASRDAQLMELGYRIIRIRNEMVFQNMDEVISMITG